MLGPSFAQASPAAPLHDFQWCPGQPWLQDWGTNWNTLYCHDRLNPSEVDVENHDNLNGGNNTGVGHAVGGVQSGGNSVTAPGGTGAVNGAAIGGSVATPSSGSTAPKTSNKAGQSSSGTSNTGGSNSGGSPHR